MHRGTHAALFVAFLPALAAGVIVWAIVVSFIARRASVKLALVAMAQAILRERI